MALLLIWLGSAVAFFGSLIAQHWFHLDPCSWCIAQRVAAGVALSLASLAYILPKGPSGFFTGLSGLVWSLGLGAAGYQSYEYYWGDLASCGGYLNAKLGFFTMDYPWTAWILEPTAMCSEANKLILGLPLSVWSLTGFMLILIGFILGSIYDAKPKFL